MPRDQVQQVRDLVVAERPRSRARDAPDHVVAALATHQHGVVTLAQLLDAGLTHSAVLRRAQAGRLHRLHRGVYAVGHTAIGRHGRYLAATFAAGPGGVLSHPSAAADWGLIEHDGTIHVTVPGARRRRSSGLHLHGARLTSADVTIRDGIPVTTVARTLLDCAETMTVQQVVAMLDRGESLRVIDLAAVRAAMARSGGRRGMRRLRDALLTARPEAMLTRSELERRALRLIAAHRLPRPEVNAKLGRYEIDLLWRDRRLAVELDGWAFHRDAAAFERDRRRDADLVHAGWRVVRLTWRQVVSEPPWVARTLRQLLDADVRDVVAGYRR